MQTTPVKVYINLGKKEGWVRSPVHEGFAAKGWRLSGFDQFEDPKSGELTIFNEEVTPRTKVSEEAEGEGKKEVRG